MGICRNYLHDKAQESIIFLRTINFLYKNIYLTTKSLVRFRLMSKSLTTQVPAAAVVGNPICLRGNRRHGSVATEAAPASHVKSCQFFYLWNLAIRLRLSYLVFWPPRQSCFGKKTNFGALKGSSWFYVFSPCVGSLS